MVVRIFRLISMITVLGFTVGLMTPVAAGEVNSSTFGNVAIEGTDPVAYFKDGRALEGSDAFEVEWKGAIWRFASAENRNAFQLDPARYAPQYGGYCAWAVSQGYTAAIDPEAWKIVDGKLYLNYSKGIQQRWAEDIPARIREADANWPSLKARQ